MTQHDREKWDRKYAEANLYQDVSQVVLAYQAYFPTSGSALDVAGGAGRHAVWLAKRGMDVTIVDVSPVALRQANCLAEESGVSLHSVCHDLDLGLPIGSWDLIFSNLFFDRRLFEEFQNALTPGGRLVVIQPTQTNATRHAKPPEKFLPQDNELPELVDGLNVILYETGWFQEGRFDAVLVAERPQVDS
ncbi:MAG: SAM-dependent methyltransferase [Planctomycetaceae bacterium]|nr:SAM-dependent methyltransferase [Planctomycetaceae bacterium]|tara:strand:- start:289 stop:858 length:570 start_codon:yes stop_codon:yes gene_type:complete